MQIQKVVSPKGIEAWLVEEHTLPLIAMQLGFDGGSAQDPAGKDGETVRRIRDEIEARVRALVAELADDQPS